MAPSNMKGSIDMALDVLGIESIIYRHQKVSMYLTNDLIILKASKKLTN